MEERALSMIQAALEQYDTLGCNDHHIALAFSGGKESVLLLHLLARAGVDVTRLLCVYFESADAWPEVRAFVQHTAATTPLQRLVVLPLPTPEAGGYRAALAELQRRYPAVEALFMGTRRSDPHGAHFRGPMEPTSTGWPQFMRVCPLLDWTTDDVWRTIRAQKLALCALYEQGHPSLGDSAQDGRRDRDAHVVGL